MKVIVDAGDESSQLTKEAATAQRSYQPLLQHRFDEAAWFRSGRIGVLRSLPNRPERCLDVDETGDNSGLPYACPADCGLIAGDTEPRGLADMALNDARGSC